MLGCGGGVGKCWGRCGKACWDVGKMWKSVGGSVEVLGKCGGCREIL